MKLLEEKRDELAEKEAPTWNKDEYNWLVYGSFKAGFDAAVKELEPVLKELVDTLAFTVNAAENLYHPELPVHEGMSPMFYHTLTYEGDVELIKKTKKAQEVFQKYKQLTGEK